MQNTQRYMRDKLKQQKRAVVKVSLSLRDQGNRKTCSVFTNIQIIVICGHVKYTNCPIGETWCLKISLSYPVDDLDTQSLTNLRCLRCFQI